MNDTLIYICRTGGASSFVPDSKDPDYFNNALTNCFQFQPSIPSEEKEEIILQQTNSGVDRKKGGIWGSPHDPNGVAAWSSPTISSALLSYGSGPRRPSPWRI